jgi:2-methylcitrate dehydratase PrpD
MTIVTDTTANPIDRLAHHVVNTRFEDLDAATLAKAKTFLLDTFGVGIAGTSGAKIDELLATVRSWGSGVEARVFLTGERLPAQGAAILNAYQIHCLEFDCVHEGAVVHPMATILSAVLAHCERRSGDGRPVGGRDLILALTLGVDVAAFIGMASKAAIRFFRPATCGGFGAVAALGKLEGFDIPTLKSAFGGMYGQTSGTLQAHAEGSPLLGLQIGFNARGALSAIDLAASGFRGPHDVLTGQYGYFRLFEQDSFDVVERWRDLGRVFQMTRLSHKPFPSGRLTHGVVDALRQLKARHAFSSDDVESIVATVPPLTFRLVGRPDLPTPEANYAKLCLRFVAGLELAHGRVDVLDFRGRQSLDDPRVHAFAAKVDVRLDEANPDPNALDPQHFVVRLKSGPTHEIHLQRTYGHPEAALSEAENLAKFRRCAVLGRRPLPERAIERLIDRVAALEKLTDVSDLVAATLA